MLLAEDDPAVRGLILAVLRKESIEVDVARDGVEAIAQLERRNYAVILLDLNMPRCDGFSVVDFLKRQPLETRPIVIVVSATSDACLSRLDPSLVAGILRKPFDIHELSTLVRGCLSYVATGETTDVIATESLGGAGQKILITRQAPLTDA